MNLILPFLFAITAAAAPPIGTSGTIAIASSATISGIIMPDQWGNPWVQIGVGSEPGIKMLVEVFDCAGKPKIIGEIPNISLGGIDHFLGFKPYLNATLKDLAAESTPSPRHIWPASAIARSAAAQFR